MLAIALDDKAPEKSQRRPVAQGVARQRREKNTVGRGGVEHVLLQLLRQRLAAGDSPSAISASLISWRVIWSPMVQGMWLIWLALAPYRRPERIKRDRNPGAPLIAAGTINNGRQGKQLRRPRRFRRISAVQFILHKPGKLSAFRLEIANQRLDPRQFIAVAKCVNLRT